MNDRSPLLPRLAGRGAAWGIRAWMRTMHYRAVLHDPQVDPRRPAPTPRIYVFWHEYILIPLYLRGHCHLTMLLSKHRDADLLGEVARHMGFDCVRGSTFNGAAAALRQLSRCGQTRHLAITPDGPRGPRRTLAQGAVFLASRLQLPIVPLGFGICRPWRANSWDRFAVPRPGARIRCVLGREIAVAPDLGRDALEAQRLAVEQTLNALTDAAEEWAESGRTLEGAIPARRQGTAAASPRATEPAPLRAAG